MRFFKIGIVLILMLFVSSIMAQSKLNNWSEGYLDIHHINTASGDVTYFIFPDGTSMLFDLGASMAPDNPEYFQLKTNVSNTPAQIVAKYIMAVHPMKDKSVLNYAVISHFHTDHYGKVTEGLRESKDGNYLLTGITEIGQYIPVKTLIDRAYPAYDFPKGLKEYYRNDATFNNYLKYVALREDTNRTVACLRAGSKEQITTKFKSYPEFEVRNLKANNNIWSGQGEETFSIESDYSSLINNKGFNENPLSLALLIRYGEFEYFTGGDLTGYNWRNVTDMETPLANVLGEVDALALNHHGFHDATNTYFMETLNPEVVVNQSRHTPHFQFTPLQQIVKVKSDLYVNNLHEATFELFSEELKSLIKGRNGHVVIRVYPKGKEYKVFTIDDSDFQLKILKQQHNTYISRSK